MSLGAMGAFTSLDLFFFYIFHDFALIPTFLLIGIWGSQNRQFASFQVTIYLLAGSLVLLAGLVALVMERCRRTPAPSTFPRCRPTSTRTRFRTRRRTSSSCCSPSGSASSWGLFPFHSWAPPGYASAPPAAAMLHAGILKKYALYGMIRITIPMLHDGFVFWQWMLLLLLAGNFLYAGFITLAQKELPTMLGFSSIMHMGYLFLGIACWNVIGVTGAVVLMVAHGLSAALLFGLSGEITHRAGENRFSRARGPGQARAGAGHPLQLRLHGLDGRARPGQLRGRAHGLFRLLHCPATCAAHGADRDLRHGHHRHLPAPRDQERLLRPDAATASPSTRPRRPAIRRWSPFPP